MKIKLFSSEHDVIEFFTYAEYIDAKGEFKIISRDVIILAMSIKIIMIAGYRWKFWGFMYQRFNRRVGMRDSRRCKLSNFYSRYSIQHKHVVVGSCV